MKSCSTCKHYCSLFPAHCRRFPPEITGDGASSYYPGTTPDKWCGEYRFSLRKWLRKVFKRKGVTRWLGRTGR